jgi:hypothetical protein
MTGWRLGWMVVPESLVAPIEMLAQHLFICASTVSQYAPWPASSPKALPNTNAAAPSSRPAATTSSRLSNRSACPCPSSPMVRSTPGLTAALPPRSSA